MPWYLQVEAPRHATTTDPPPLPELPRDPPRVMEPLLKYVSEEMGLDNLALLDLRELQPPPALGSNLFMLFGTARSERHLNVSAGRLVRWLRAKHRIYADADGLLGPNERKTKLKRKAKRARLLGTMRTDEADDGISTGWICVNLGTIDRDDRESTVLGQDGRVSGFGVTQKGSTIVVQVMTESRRAELDLETLWQKALVRQSKKSSETNADGSEESHRAEQVIVFNSQSPSSYGSRTMQSPYGLQQARSFCTSRRAMATMVDPLQTSPQRLATTLMHDAHQKVRLVDILRAHLNSIQERQQVHETLSSSSFLKTSELAMKNLQPEQTWALRLAIETKARQMGRQGHLTLESIRQLVDEFRLLGVGASRDECMQLLFCIYLSPAVKLQEKTALALSLLESLHLRGQPVMANDIMVAIIEAVCWTRTPDDEMLALQSRIEELMFQAKLPWMGEPLLMRLMGAYYAQKN